MAEPYRAPLQEGGRISQGYTVETPSGANAHVCVLGQNSNLTDSLKQQARAMYRRLWTSKAGGVNYISVSLTKAS